jgi:hypothetical protein
MLRLADRILLQKSTFQPKELADNPTWEKIMHSFITGLQKNTLPIIIADNIEKYLFPADKPLSAYDIRQGCGKPPFEACFIEWINNYDPIEGIKSGQNTSQVGVLLVLVNKHLTKNLPPETQCELRGFVFHFVNNRISTIGCEFVIGLDSNGSILGVVRNKDTSFSIPCVIAHTLSFMNCKNVTIQDDTDEYAQPAKWYRRTKVPQVSYHTINIQPTTIRRNPNPTSTDIQQRLHICRGHFMHYKEDGPGMFGRGVYGRFWVPQHQRGSGELGVVHSRYNVSPPVGV